MLHAGNIHVQVMFPCNNFVINTDFIIQTSWQIKCAVLKSVGNTLEATSLPRTIQNCSESYGRHFEGGV